MAWTESGLYANALAASLGVSGGTLNWLSTTNKFFLTNTSDAPNYAASLASSIYAVTNEVTGTGWAAGGIAVSALAAGSASIAPSFTITGPGPSVTEWQASNISVASTTLSGILGGYFYSTTATANYKLIGIYFGGTAYATVAGTFAVTWSSSNIATITCAA
jgi:hypothetical protein